jgi:hypothetical protein
MASKKLPPPPNMFEDVEFAGFGLEKLSRPEKGEGLAWGGAGAPNDRLLKASFIPPNPLCWSDCCCCGAPIPLNGSCRADC